ncbi:MAG: acetate--CoA ligase family protein [Deltaproteobacteria bacterium]|nr:acetate--CoA ligase family protein [Deltaproteobacteria bacterium]MCL5277972.1 acetate--CoA ligase family protein [Deltaproteobacteria bacterium]
MSGDAEAIKGIFYPEGVAIFGVSESPDNLAHIIVKNMLYNKFMGKIYLIGRRAGEVEGMRVHTGIGEISDHVDLSVILTPARSVPSLLSECGLRGIRYAVVESGGFSEAGDDGLLLEQDLKKVSSQYGIRFTGPNGLGVINTENGLCTPFSPITRPIRKGGVSIISQSGGMSLTLLGMLSYEGVGIDKVISAGNKADIDEIDYLSYLEQDPGTAVIGMYLEDIKNGRSFVDLIRAGRKPVVVLKSNVYPGTAHIAMSHASAMANDDLVLTHAMREAGAIRVDSLTDFVDTVKLLSISHDYGRRIAVLSRSGGHAVITQDAIVQYGFETPQFSGHFLGEVGRHVRAGVISLTNPLDMGDVYDFDFYRRAIELALADPSFDTVVFIHTYSPTVDNGSSESMAKTFAGLRERYNKPLLPLFFTETDTLSRLKETIDYPFFIDPATMLKSAAKIRDARLFRRGQGVRPAHGDRSSVHGETTTLSLMGSLNAVEYHDIGVAPWSHARSVAEARKISVELGYPVAMKVESMAVSHKSDVGGVVLDIDSDRKATDAFEWLTEGIRKTHPEITTNGVVVQKMLIGGIELIVGAKRDVSFGPVVIVGIGGIYTELLRDTGMGLCPVDGAYALGMLKDLKGYALLEGTRGQRRLAVEQVARLITKVSAMMIEKVNIVELDLNPVLVDGEKALALDARVIVEKTS